LKTYVPAFPRDNNLNWLRLIFAFQVVVVHVGEILDFRLPDIVGNFPGVPAFFFVSGFLIYASYRNAPGRRYFENRFLRLFPGLLAVTLGGACVALFARGWHDVINHFPTYAGWFVAQVTLGQAYNPDLFRQIGTGVINGALWTITTEILFYMAVPVIVRLEARFRHTVIVLIALSFVIYAINPSVWTWEVYRRKSIYDVLAITPIVWGWMFGFGILAVKHFGAVQRWGKYLPWLLVPLVVQILVGEGLLFHSTGNRVGIIYYACYAGLVVWLAFFTRYVPLTVDLSYGVYIWHLPVANLLLVLGEWRTTPYYVITLMLAALSWFLVEKPALGLKRKSLHPIERPATLSSATSA
jgi:peptidoglycan/LPS O-acetylase OafA/YrhL